MVLDPDSTPTEAVCLWLLRHKSLSPSLAREIRRQYAGITPAPATRPTTRPAAPGQSDTEARIRQWWRELAVRHHPDHGGDPRIMAALADARDRLRQALNSV